MAKHIENLVISKLESIILICHYGNSWAAKIIELKDIFRMGPMENGIICKFVAIMQICNIAVLWTIGPLSLGQKAGEITACEYKHRN